MREENNDTDDSDASVRDRVNSHGRLIAAEQGKFKISDLPITESERHTARRVLRELEELGWLARTNNRASTWRIGKKAARLMNVSPTTIQFAWGDVSGGPPWRRAD